MADQEKHLKYGENRSLFSDYFLSERLDQKKEWNEDISTPFQKILQIYSEKKEALPYFNNVLNKFESSSKFPGGKTRTIHEKLMEYDVPVFDEKANIEPLIELREELAETEEKIEKTDWLIDRVVYQLYGLIEEEVKVVEGNIK